MRTIIVLALASLAIAACSYHSESTERQTPSGRTVVTDSAGIGPLSLDGN